MGLVKILLVKTLLTENIQVKESVPHIGLAVIHFQMSRVPCSGHKLAT